VNGTGTRWFPVAGVVIRATAFFYILILIILKLYRAKRNMIQKGKIHPRTGHEGPEGELNSFLNLGARERGVVNATPGRFAPQKETGTHFTGHWLGPRTCLDGCGKSRLRQDWNP
jgi:hypothetical protein